MTHKHTLTHSSARQGDVEGLVRDATLGDLIKELQVIWDLLLFCRVEVEAFLVVCEIVVTNVVIEGNRQLPSECQG